MNKRHSTSKGEASVPPDTASRNGKVLASTEKIQAALKDSQSNEQSNKPDPKLTSLLMRLLPLLGIGAVALVGSFLWQRQQAQIHSIQAFVNSELIYIRAPISGKLSLQNKLDLGQKLTATEVIGTVIGEVENPRVSELRVREQELRSRLQVNRQQLNGIEQQLANRENLLEKFSQASSQEHKLRIEYSQMQVKQAEDDIKRAIAEYEIAKSDAERSSTLLAEGGTSFADAEKLTGLAKETEAGLAVAQSRLKEKQIALKASLNGIQLDNARTFSYPEIREIELQTEIIDLEQRATDIRRQIKTTQAELEKVQQELQTQNRVLLQGLNGVIWSIDGRSGENVDANAPILQLLNCQEVWVEAFFNEVKTNFLSPGDRVAVKLVGTEQVWPGVIETLRAGTGRVNIGEFVAQPPPEIERRQLPVRVVTARIKVDWQQAQPTPEEFCWAGRSVEVKAIQN